MITSDDEKHVFTCDLCEKCNITIKRDIKLKVGQHVSHAYHLASAIDPKTAKLVDVKESPKGIIKGVFEDDGNRRVEGVLHVHNCGES